MKVINSYIPNTGNNEARILPYQALGLALSSALARKHYDKVELYTSSIMYEVLEKLQLPYTYINVVDDSLINNIGPMTVPKVAIMSIQEEPFIHIDYDTFLYRKLDEDKLHEITFCHPDVPKVRNIAHLCGVYDSYGALYREMNSKLPQWYYDVEVTDLPNMNMVAIPAHRLDVFKMACKLALTYYYDHKENWDKHAPSGIAVEQLGIAAILKKLQIETDFYFNDIPSAIDATDSTFRTWTFSNHVENSFYEVDIDLDNNPEALVDEEFGGYVHTSGYWLNRTGTIRMMKQKLIYMGHENVVKNIEKFLE